MLFKLKKIASLSRFLVCCIYLISFNCYAVDKLDTITDVQDDGEIIKINSDCVFKKKIILNLGVSGLGNRMIALASAAFLAIRMDRVLEIIWEKNLGCQETYFNLFERPRIFDKKGSFQPFIYWGEYDPPIPIKMKRERFLFCSIHFSDKVENENEDPRYIHFNMLTDPVLFKKVQDECDVISLDTNLYFAYLVLGSHIGKNSERYYSIWKNPFQDISKILFHPARDIMSIVSNLQLKMRKVENVNKPWIAIHARAIFTSKGNLNFKK